MKRLQEETMCKMAVLGRGSMKDRKKVGLFLFRLLIFIYKCLYCKFYKKNQEDELRASLDPKYAHLNDDLHVEISSLAPPAEAHARTAYALAEVRKYLIPDSNDCIRQEQIREMIADGTISVDEAEEHGPPSAPPPPQYHNKVYHKPSRPNAGSVARPGYPAYR